jgi:hypothetical protein
MRRLVWGSRAGLHTNWLLPSVNSRELTKQTTSRAPAAATHRIRPWLIDLFGDSRRAQQQHAIMSRTATNLETLYSPASLRRDGGTCIRLEYVPFLSAHFHP